MTIQLHVSSTVEPNRKTLPDRDRVETGRQWITCYTDLGNKLPGYGQSVPQM